MNGSAALVTVHKTEGGMQLRAVDEKGHAAKLPLEMDAAAGMLLADAIHVACERRAWAAGADERVWAPELNAMTDRLAALTALALKMHEGQVDQQGKPYSEHILAVTAAVSKRAKPVALFHDAVDDRRTTWGHLSTVLSAEEFAAVHVLTRHGSSTYAQYVDGIRARRGSIGNLAREVKVADLRHNLGRLTPELESLRPRYEAALAVLDAEPTP